MGNPNHTKTKKLCLNCGTSCEDEYCPHCGQKTSTERFEVKQMFRSIITPFIGADNKLWGTCGKLLTSPGYMVRDFLLGKRARYYNPMSLLIFLVALLAIVSCVFTDAVSPFDIFRPQIQVDNINSSSAEKFVYYYQLILQNKVYFAIFAVIINLFPYRFVFRNYKLMRPSGSAEHLNVAEHFYVLLYQACFNLLLAFILYPLSTFSGSEVWIARICAVMPTVYCVILYKQILDITWIRSTLMNIAAVALSLIMNLLIMLFVFGLLYGFDNIRN